MQDLAEREDALRERVDEIERLAVLINKLGVETKKRKKNRSYNNLNELTSSNHLVKKPSGLNPAG